MAGFSVSVTGFKELQDQLKNLPKELEVEVGTELKIGAEEIRERAIKDAPSDQNTLRSGIVKEQVGKLSWIVASNAAHSAFIEFGTRSNVIIPPGIEESLGDIVKVQSVLSAKEAIFNWCKRHGIEQKAWYPIYIKIMTKGIKAHPFFFKQQEIVGPKLVRNIQSVLDDKRLD